MNSSFVALVKNQFDRNFGGTLVGVADPYISGYHFIHFVKIPDKVPVYANRVNTNTWGGGGGSGGGSTQEITNTLNGSCLSVTPPGGTLNKTEFIGLGGIKFAVPTNIDYTNTMTIKFLEFSSLPILSIFSGWIRMIRDYRTGVSNLEGSEYTKSNYAGSVLYWTTKPDGKTVEFSAFYTGVFPTKDPLDLYSGDLSAVDKLEVDIEFNVDWTWHEPWVHSRAQELASLRGDAGKAYRGAAGGGSLESADGVDKI